MEITDARFVVSSANYKDCPKPVFPEYAFIGRSNVGKSSLINMLVGRRKLAKTSATPGKTQLINHFFINNSFYIADLPGLGYAKTSKKDRKEWSVMVRNYLQYRQNLLNTFVLVDSRIPPQGIDLDFTRWLGINQIPFMILFTKTDKLKANQIKKNIQTFKNQFLKDWEEMPMNLLTSSVTKEGRDTILDYIEETNQLFKSY